jgi:hypothetical protein
LAGHFVVIVELQPKLLDNDKQFGFRYVDSLTGKIESAHVALEQARPFSATRSFAVARDGSLEWQWVEGYPYLVVTAPSLRLSTDKEPWQARTIIVLRHVVLPEGLVAAEQ